MAREREFDEINISQIPALEVLKELGYTYLSPGKAEAMRGSLYNVLLLDILKERLTKINSYTYKGKTFSFTEKHIEQAVKDLDITESGGLVKTNEKIYNYLLMGKPYSETMPDGAKRSFNINYIDWDTIENNLFHVVEEFRVQRADGSGTIRPDIVLFVNGIPFAVIECKKASLSTKQGISQMIRNQGKTYAPHLFRYIQLVMSTNKNETKYATCGTDERFWANWKEEDEDWLAELLTTVVKKRTPAAQDKNIISLFSKERLFELVRYFIVYDLDVKKIARYQQYFAIKEIIKTVEEDDEMGNRQGGVIWHTQGSGKSITMVMVARFLLKELPRLAMERQRNDRPRCNPRIVVVTDRKNLDKQIKDTFVNSKQTAVQAASARKLVEHIQDDSIDVITTLVHKFEGAVRLLSPVLSRDIFILVDESHRTQYGELNKKMKKVFPNACYLGFTGTPLMKDEKSTMVKFGTLIHSYTITDGVKDKAIVPLIYEGKMVEQSINRKAIDKKLEKITKKLNDTQKEAVKKKWSKYKKIASSIQRLEFIADDISDHFCRNYKVHGTQFKAMLATGSKIEAIKYAMHFEEEGELNCAVVISPPDQREGYSEVDAESKDLIIQYWNKMISRYKNADEYEEIIKDEFIKGDELDLLIVVDKLLTGFDAPRATILYIDKPMKEHTLLQAIARVNRLYEGKDFGYIIDYRGLLANLDAAMETYSGAGLEKFDPEDLKGTIYDVISIIGTLRHHYSELKDMFKSIKNKSDTTAYQDLLEDDELREKFYSELCQFGKNLAVVFESDTVYEALSEDEISGYKKDFKFFRELRQAVKIRYSDDIDHKEYEAKMQKLMDNYIAAEDVIQITKPIDILDAKGFQEELERLETPRAKADAIRTRMTKSINEKWGEDPAYYKKFSQRIKEALEAYKDKRITEAEYLEKMNDIKRDYADTAGDGFYPENIKSYQHARAFYGVVKDNFDFQGVSGISNEYFGELSIEVDDIMKNYTKVDWHDNTQVRNKIKQEIDDLIHDFLAAHGITMDYDSIDALTERLEEVALNRY